MTGIRIHPYDTVAVALELLTPGQTLTIPDYGTVLVREEIPAGHKIALRSHKPGEQIVKYGSVIGTATAEIAAGTLVHSHNCKTNLS